MSINKFNQVTKINDTTDSSNVSSGSLLSLGGLGVSKNISLGANLNIKSINSNYTTIKASDTATTSTFTLPSTPPVTSGLFLVSDSQGNLSFAPSLSNVPYTFNASNNQAVAANISNLLFTSGSFSIDLSIDIVATSSLSELIQLSGLSNPTTGWSLNTIHITGDSTGIIFTITSGGQIQYTTPSFPGFTSITFRWSVVSDSYVSTNLLSGRNFTGAPSSNGSFFNVNASTFTDSNTTTTLSNFNGMYIGVPTINATNTGVTTTTANTLYIDGAPVAGANETITKPYSLNVNSGNSVFGGNVSITGSISKGSGTFEIEHPLYSDKKLVHSFVEAPRCDNIYRGTVQLKNGLAIVNIDFDCTQTLDCSMSKGTFESLNKNTSFYLQNNDSFDRVKGFINKGILYIECENNKSNDFINWLVIGERKDKFIKQWEYTNDAGSLITERN